MAFVPLFEGDGFNDLRYLEVIDCELKFIISSNEHDESMTFANLELLRLRKMRSLEMICHGKAPLGMFSNLRHLILFDLYNLKCGLPLTLVLLNLSSVSVRLCPNLETIFDKEASVSENKTDIVPFPLLKSLELDGVDALSNVLRQPYREISTVEGVPVDLFDSKSIFPSLEKLELGGSNHIERLWNKACDVSSFQNLKVLRIVCCYWLLSLGSPSMFAALVQLEELKIRNCYSLKEVVTKETEEHEVSKHVIVFSLLQRLSLEELPNLERFYGGSYKLEFPNLKYMRLSDAGNPTNSEGLENSTDLEGSENSTNLEGSENSVTFFSDKIEYPCLEELEVWNVSNQVASLLNWSSLYVQGESESSSSSLNPLPNLQKLTLGQIRGLMSIPHFISHKLSHLRVRDFHEIKTLSVLVGNREVLGTYSQFPNVEHLSIGHCDSLEQLFENEDDDSAVVMFCEHLIGITLDNMPQLKTLPFHLLRNIRTLTLNDLSWEYVFSADLFIKGSEQLQQLEDLIIDGCSDMEVIIMDKLARDGEDRIYSFPRLKNLELVGVRSMTCFASNPGVALHLPSLEKFYMNSCHKLQSCFSGPLIAPKLKLVEIYGCTKLQSFVSGKMNDIQELPSLETVIVERCSQLLSFSSEPLVAPKLHSVLLNGSYKMKQFSPGDPSNEDILDLPSLEIVSIESCAGMRSFSSGGIKAPNLCKLEIDKKDYSKRANEELQVLLMNLCKSPHK